MSLCRCLSFTALLVASAGLPPLPLRAQMPPHLAAEPPVPADPLELVSGDAQPVPDVATRANIISLLLSSLRQGNVRMNPYDLKTRFTAFGSSASDGSWQMEDSSPGGDLYRWTAQGPAYSAINLYSHRVLYSNQPAVSVPLRLAQVRAALFFMQPMLGPRAAIRTAPATLNGVELVCALVSHGELPKATTGPRRWEEAEYCADPKSLNLVTYSPVPGMYVQYDYSSAFHLEGSVIADKFTITQGGHTIIEAQTESLTAPSQNPALFAPAGLNQIGVGSLMTQPWRMRRFLPAVSGTTAPQVVVLHGMQSETGALTEVELITSTSAALNGTALEDAASWQPASMAGQIVESGATPQSHEILLTLQYGASEQQQ